MAAGAQKPCYGPAMRIISAITWSILPFLNYGSLLLMLGGVAWFGLHLVRTAMRRPDDNNLSPAIWHGAPTRLALKMLGAGVALQIFTIIMAAIVPGRL
jgi:hypothetical protein